MSSIPETSDAADLFAELISTLELRLFGRQTDEPPLDTMEIQELYATFEQCVRFFPDVEEFHSFAVPGKTHDDFLFHWKKLEDIIDEMPGADEDIVPMWRELTKIWWEENREDIKEVVEEIKGAKVHAGDQ